MKKHPLILLVAMLTALLGWMACVAVGATIDGTETVQIGQLATFSADVEGDWIVVPAKGVWVAKDTGKKALYLSAMREGEYTLIFFSVENGQPVITQRAVTVGNPEPEPTPEPSPEPSPTLNLTDAEKAAASSAFREVLTGIESGTIRTPQGARSTFKTALVQKVSRCSGGTCTLSPGLTAAVTLWESSMDITTLPGIREGFTKAKEGL